METKRTPGKWNFHQLQESNHFVITENGHHGRHLAQVYKTTVDDSEANARYIVEAVNNFDAMANALRAVLAVCVDAPASTIRIRTIKELVDAALAAIQEEEKI